MKHKKTIKNKETQLLNNHKYAGLFTLLAVILISFVLFAPQTDVTGKVSFGDFETQVMENSLLTGKIDLLINSTDYLPTSTKLKLSYNDESIEIPLSELSHNLATVESNYVYNNIILNNSGSAYTTKKYKITYPDIQGTLLLEKDNYSEAIDFMINANTPFAYEYIEECSEVEEDIITYYNNTIINTYNITFNCTYTCINETCLLTDSVQLDNLDIETDASCVATLNQTLPNQNNTETILVEQTTLSVDDTTIVEESTTTTSTRVICASIDDLDINVQLDGPYQISVSDNTIVVSTNFSSIVYGEGAEYTLGDDYTIVSYDLEDANFYALESGLNELSLELIYQDEIFAEISKIIDVEQPEDEIIEDLPEIEDIIETPIDEIEELNLTESNESDDVSQPLSSDPNLEDVLTQGDAEVGKDVEWTRVIKLKSNQSGTVNLSLVVPEKTKEITIVELDKNNVQTNANFEIENNNIDNIVDEIIEDIQADDKISQELIDVKPQENLIKEAVSNITKTETEIKEQVKEKVKQKLEDNGVEQENVKTIKLTTGVDNKKDVVVKYTTEGPSQQVQDISDDTKLINVNSEVHYKDIKTGYDLPIQLSEDKARNAIQLYEIVDGNHVYYQDIAYIDSDNNSLIDRIEWTIPHLSNTTFEVRINVLTVHSQPAVGQNWRIKFDTVGTADLSIYGFDGTVLGTDVDYTFLKCDGDLVDNVVYENNIISVQDYSCDSTSELALLELLPGDHSIKFEFGGDEAEAYNLAGQMNCTMRTNTCNAGETLVMRLSNYTNAHAELFNMSSVDYTDVICCWDEGNNINLSVNATRTSDVLGDALIMTLSDDTNAHAGNVSEYDLKLWMNSTQSLLTSDYVRIPGGTCEGNGYQTCIVTLSNFTNAHLASCDNDPYDWKICADLNNRAPSVNLLSPDHDYYINTDFNFTYNVSDPDGIVDINNCTLWTNISGAGFTLFNTSTSVDFMNYIPYNLAVAEEKEISWKVNCTDLGNDYKTSSTWTLFTDNIIPSIYGLNSTDPDNVTRSDVSLTYAVNASDTYMQNVTLQGQLMNLISGLYSLTGTPSSIGCTIDGSCTIVATALDKAGNLNTTNYTMIIDDTFPVISFNSGTENNDSYMSQNYIEIGVDITETNQRNNSYYLYNSTNDLINFTTYALDLDENYTNLADGIYYYKADVWDKADNYNITETRTITLDTVNPAIFNLRSNETDNYTRNDVLVKFEVDIVDVNIDYVELGNDTLVNMTLGVVDGYNTSWYKNIMPSALGCSSEGTCVLRAIAHDKAGNTNTTYYNITIDNTNPVITLFTPVDYYNTTNTSVPIVFNVTDNLDPYLECVLYVDGNINNTNNSVSNNVQTTIYANVAYNKTDYEYNISCRDSSGNQHNSIIKHFTVDQEKPMISITRPDTEEIIGRTITVESIVTDFFTSVNTVWYEMYNRTNDALVFNGTMPNTIGDYFANSAFDSLTYCLENTTACPVYIVVYANDTVNNTESLTRNFTLDNNRPSLNINVPWISYHNVDFDMNLTATDYLINITGYNITNSTGINYQGNFTGNINSPTHEYLDLIDLSNYPDDNYTIFYYAYDYFNNYVNKSTWFIIDTTLPALSNFDCNDSDDVSRSDVDILYSLDVNELYIENVTLYNKNNMSANMLMFTSDPAPTMSYSVILELEDIDCASDGLCELIAIAYDKAGNNNTIQDSVIVDNTNPTIIYNTESFDEHNPALTPIDMSYIQQDAFNVNVTTNDSNDRNLLFRLFDSTTMIINNMTNDTSAYPPGAITMANSFTGLNDGVYYFEVIATDKADNTNTTQRRKVTIDTTNPAIYNLRSNDTDNVSRNDVMLNFTVNSTDLNIDYIELGNDTYINMTRGALPTGDPSVGVHRYNFNQNVLDLWDANNLAVTGVDYAASYPSFGRTGDGAGYSGNFDGGDYVNTNSAVNIDGGSGAISLWINPDFDETSITTRYLFDSTNNNGGRTAFFLNSSIQAWQLYIHNTQIFGGMNGIINLIEQGQWSNIIVTWDTNNQYIYVDGELKAQANIALTDTIKAETLYFGSDSSSANYYRGYIDELHYYDLTLDNFNAMNLYEHNDIRPAEQWYIETNLSTICSSITQGLCTVNAIAYDKATNTNVTTYNIFVDNDAPILIDLKSNETDNYTRNDVLLNFTVDIIDPSIEYVELGNSTLVNMSMSNFTMPNSSWYKVINASDLGCTTEGICTIKAIAHDKAQNSNTSYYNLTIDNTDPVVTLFTPVNHYNTTSATIPIVFNVTDNLDPYLECGLIVDGVLNNTNNSVLNNVQTTIYANLAQNKTDYAYTITCYDSADNSNISITKYFTVDQEDPAITITRPIADEIVGRNITVTATVTDIYTSVNTVWYEVKNRTNDALVYNSTMADMGGNVYSDNSFDSTTYCPDTIVSCPVYVVVYANDTVDNVNDARQNFTIDNQNPVMNIYEPWYSHHNENFNMNLTTFNHRINVSYYDIENSTGANYQNNYIANIDNPNHQYLDLINISNYPDDNYTLYYKSIDYANNSMNKSTWFIIDTTAPVLFDLYSEQEDNITRSDVTLEYNVTVTELYVDNVTLYNKNNLSAYVVMNNVTSGTTKIYSASSTLDALDCSDDGVCELMAEAYDEAGNIGRTYYNITVDNTNPGLFFIDELVNIYTPTFTPTNDSYIDQDWFNIYVNITDPHKFNITYTLFNSNMSVNKTASYDLSGEASGMMQKSHSFINLADGIYYYNVITYDKADNSNITETRKLTIDTVDPLIYDLKSDDDDNITRSDELLNFTVNVTDVNSWYTELGNSTLTNMTMYSLNGNDSAWYNITTLDALGCSTDGLCTLRAIAHDLAQNTNVTYYTMTVDNTNPLIEYISPTKEDNYYANVDNIEVNVSVVETNEEIIEFRLYNSTYDLINYTNSTTGLRYMNYQNLDDGIYYYNVTVQDYAWNVNSTPTYKITIDTTYPTINFTDGTELNDTFFARTYAYMNVTAYDLNEANMTFALYNSTMDIYDIDIEPAGTREYNFTGLPDGEYYYNVTIEDLATNTNTTELRKITLDGVAPSIFNLRVNDTDNYTRNDVLLNFSVEASDTYLVNVTLSGYLMNFSSGTTYYNISNASFMGCVSEGNCQLTAQAIDRAGNINTTSMNLTIDNTDPVVTLFTPVDYYNTTNTTIPIVFNVTDNLDPYLECYLNVDGDVNNTNLSVSNNVQTTIYANLAQNKTDYAYNISCYDSAGNLHVSATKYFTVDQEDPSITITRPVADEIVGRDITVTATVTDIYTAVEDVWYEIRNKTSDAIVHSGTLADQGGNVYSDTSFDSTAYCPDTIVSCPVYVLVYANDTVYNNEVERQNFTIDNKNPVLFIESPWYSYHNANFNMNLTAYNHMVNISYYNITNSTGASYQDNYTANINSPTFNYADLIDLSGYPDDNYTLYFYAEDYVNHSMNKSTWFVVDTTVPGIDNLFSNESDNITRSDVSLQYNVTVTELYVENVTLYNLDNMALPVSMSTSDSTLTKTYSVTSTLDTLGCNSDGVCRLMAEVYDKSGSNNQTYYNITVDDTDPVITYNVPPTHSDDFHTNETSFTVNVSVTEDNEYSVEFNLYNSTYDLINNTLDYASLRQLVYTYPDGVYYYNITVVDKADNIGDSATYKLTVDTVNPSSTITLPLNDTLIAKNNIPYTITGTASDNHLLNRIELDLNGTSVNATGTTAWNYVWTPTIDGDYIIRSIAHDQATNTENTLEDIYLTIFTTANIYNSTIENCTLTNTTVYDSNITDSIIDNSTITNSTLIDVNYSNVNISDSYDEGSDVGGGDGDIIFDPCRLGFNTYFAPLHVTDSRIYYSTLADSRIVNAWINNSYVNDTELYISEMQVFEPDGKPTNNFALAKYPILDSRLIDSEINDSTLTNSNSTGSDIYLYSVLQNSQAIDATIINCTLINMTFSDELCLDNTLSNSNITDTNVTGDSVVDNSNITNSTVDDSDITDSTIENSDIVGSIIDNSTVINSTIVNSTIINSTVTNSTVINCSNIINLVLQDDYCLDGSIINIPAVISNKPDDDSYTPSDDVVFNWTAIQDRELINNPINMYCNLTINNTINQSNIASFNGTATTYTVNGMADGIYYWNVTCKDEVRVNTSETRKVTVDTTYPTIEYVLPTRADGNYSQLTNIPINVTAYDLYETLIEFRLYNSTHDLINYTNSTTGQRYINYASMSDGIYYYNVSIYDIVNHINTTPTREITIDTINPVIENLTSSDSDNISRNDVVYTISVFANDTNIKDVLINGNALTRSMPSSIWSIASNMSDLGCAGEGACTITAITSDYAGHTNSTTLDLVIDNTLPTIINFTSNDTDAKIGGGQLVNYSANVTDDNLNTVQIYCNVSNALTMNNSGDIWSAVTSASAIGCTQGLQNVTLRAIDQADNINYSYYEVQVDDNAPNVTLISPANDTNIYTSFDAAVDQATINHVFTVDDDLNISKCTFHNTIGGASLSVVAATMNNPAKLTQLNFTVDVSPQSYEWRVTCYDTLNNARVSDTFKFRVYSGKRRGSSGGGGCKSETNYTEWTECVDGIQYRDEVISGCGAPRINVQNRTCLVPSLLETYYNRATSAKDKGKLETSAFNIKEFIEEAEHELKIIDEYLDRASYDEIDKTTLEISESKAYVEKMKDYLEEQIVEEYDDELTDDLYDELTDKEITEIISDYNYVLSLAERVIERMPDVQKTLDKCYNYQYSQAYMQQRLSEFDQSYIEQYTGDQLNDLLLIKKCAYNYKFINDDIELEDDQDESDYKKIYRTKYDLEIEALADLKALNVTEIISKEIADSVYDIDFDRKYNVIEEDPIISFFIDELYARQPYTISYIIKTDTAQKQIGIVTYIDGGFIETCTDFVLNQNEENIDCGGICFPCRKDKQIIFLPMLWRFLLVGVAIFALLAGNTQRERVFRAAYYYVEGIAYTPTAVSKTSKKVTKHTAKRSKYAILTTAQGFDYIGRAISMFIWIVFDTLMSVIEYLAELPVNLADEIVTLVYVLMGTADPKTLEKYYVARFAYFVIDSAESLILAIGLSIFNATEAFLNVIVYSIKNVLLAFNIGVERAYGYATHTYARGSAHVTKAGRRIEKVVDKHTERAVKTPYDVFDRIVQGFSATIMPIALIILDIPLLIAELLVINVPILFEWLYSVVNAIITIVIDIFDFVFDALAQALDLIFDVIAELFGELIDIPTLCIILVLDKFMRKSFKKTVRVQKEVAKKGQKYGLKTLFIEIGASLKYMIFEFSSFIAEIFEVLKYVFTFEFLRSG